MQKSMKRFIHLKNTFTDNIHLCNTIKFECLEGTFFNGQYTKSRHRYLTLILPYTNISHTDITYINSFQFL
uniref:Uncharacterized protein n=1 Tax=Pararge aegeria TaxID=116150 RepID=S4NRV4_9NEOP